MHNPSQGVLPALGAPAAAAYAGAVAGRGRQLLECRMVTHSAMYIEGANECGGRLGREPLPCNRCFFPIGPDERTCQNRRFQPCTTPVRFS